MPPPVQAFWCCHRQVTGCQELPSCCLCATAGRTAPFNTFYGPVRQPPATLNIGTCPSCQGQSNKCKTPSVNLLLCSCGDTSPLLNVQAFSIFRFNCYISLPCSHCQFDLYISSPLLVWLFRFQLIYAPSSSLMLLQPIQPSKGRSDRS